jgi:methylglyoxal synthase
VAWNIPVACNRASADYMISSPLFSRAYDRVQANLSRLRQPRLVGDDSDGGSLA